MNLKVFLVSGLAGSLLFQPERPEAILQAHAWLLPNLGVKGISHGSCEIESRSLAAKMHKNKLRVFPYGVVPDRSDTNPFHAKSL